jgi:YesN/AraC family two-component response regulator
MTTILVIDDEQNITSALEAALSSRNCCVQTAHNGREGLRLLRKYRFDVVITDIIMPEIDGFEVIMEINRMLHRPRVIVMTGGTMHLSREYLAEVARTLSVEHVLFKPFSIYELLDTVFPQEEYAAAAAG